MLTYELNFSQIIQHINHLYRNIVSWLPSVLLFSCGSQCRLQPSLPEHSISDKSQNLSTTGDGSAALQTRLMLMDVAETIVMTLMKQIEKFMNWFKKVNQNTRLNYQNRERLQPAVMVIDKSFSHYPQPSRRLHMHRSRCAFWTAVDCSLCNWIST